jgi:hypothetical protein
MRFVFIDSRISDINTIVSAFTEDVNYYIFDWNVDTLDILKSKLTQDYETVGIIQHNYYTATYQILCNETSSVLTNVYSEDPDLLTWSNYIGFLQWMYSNCNITAVDLFACDLWSNYNWVYVIQTIRDKFGVHIRASVNITGFGGDFILESDNFNTIGVYFTENILQYMYVFASVPLAPTINAGNTKSKASGTVTISLTDNVNAVNNDVYYYYSIGTSTQATNANITFTPQTSQTIAPSNLGFAISADGTNRIAIFCAGAGVNGIRFLKITNGTWGAITVITSSFDFAPTNTEYLGCCMTPDATRLIVPVGTFIGGSNYLYWADATGLLGSATILSFKRISSTALNYMMTSVTPDGSRLLISVYGGRIYYADWNSGTNNYGSLTPILDTNNRNYFGVFISSDKQKILYAAGTNVYWSVWNGTNYPAGTSIAVSCIDVRSVGIFGYGTANEFIISTPWGNTGAQYATWNGTGYNALSTISYSVFPKSIIGYGLVIDSTSIYLAGYIADSVRIANVSSSNVSFTSYTNSNVLFTGNGTYSFDISGLTTQNTPYYIGVRTQNSAGNSSTVSTSALSVLGAVPVISSITSVTNNSVRIIYSQAYKGTTPVTYSYSLSPDGSNKVAVSDGSFVATGVNPYATFYVVADNLAGSLISAPFIWQYPCFLECSKILRMNLETDEEEYIAVEKLKRGDLIRTVEHGYKAIELIGNTKIQNPNNQNPSKCLYWFRKSNIKGMTSDLCVTGDHCILHKTNTEEKKARVMEYMQDIYVTERHYRVPAWLDDRAELYTEPGPVTIWHFALENPNIYHNYGVMANGCLVESCSLHYMYKHSNMKMV